jgi:transcriptional regulator with PAS, ATPase and Fis domain
MNHFDFLKQYSWPGNIRELKNVIERIVLTAKSDFIRLDDIDLIVTELKEQKDEPGNTSIPGEFLNGTMKDIKSRVIAAVLKEEGYNKSKTARRLDIDRSTLERFL